MNYCVITHAFHASRRKPEGQVALQHLKLNYAIITQDLEFSSEVGWGWKWSWSEAGMKTNDKHWCFASKREGKGILFKFASTKDLRKKDTSVPSSFLTALRSADFHSRAGWRTHSARSMGIRKSRSSVGSLWHKGKHHSLIYVSGYFMDRPWFWEMYVLLLWKTVVHEHASSLWKHHFSSCVTH